MKDGRVRRIWGTVLLLGVVGSALPVRADDDHHKYLPMIADAKSVSLIGHGNFDPSSLVEEVFEAARILNKTSELRLVVVASSYEWPPRLPLDWLRKQPWPVFISTKQEGHVFFSESWGNKGDEVASYLRFIVDYWDTLPEYTAFVHGHDVSWHQMGYSMQYILRNLCLEHLRTRRYASLNAMRLRPTGKNSPFELLLTNTPLMKYASTVWRLHDLPSRHYDRCCSQFVVHRDAIRLTPKAVWEELLQLVLQATYTEWRKDRHVFELIWQHAFGVGADMVQSEWYGGKLDVSVETELPVVFSEVNSLDLVVGCPNSLCEGVLTPCGEARAKDVESPKVYYNRLWDMHDRRYKEVRAQEVRKLSAKRLKMLPLVIPQSDLARL